MKHVRGGLDVLYGRGSGCYLWIPSLHFRGSGRKASLWRLPQRLLMQRDKLGTSAFLREQAQREFKSSSTRPTRSPRRVFPGLARRQRQPAAGFQAPDRGRSRETEARTRDDLTSQRSPAPALTKARSAARRCTSKVAADGMRLNQRREIHRSRLRAPSSVLLPSRDPHLRNVTRPIGLKAAGRGLCKVARKAE